MRKSILVKLMGVFIGIITFVFLVITSAFTYYRLYYLLGIHCFESIELVYFWAFFFIISTLLGIGVAVNYKKIKIISLSLCIISFLFMLSVIGYVMIRVFVLHE
jgi:hypothetical protein